MGVRDRFRVDAALTERQVADDALAAHNRWMRQRYGHRGIPHNAPERREGDRLEAASWDALHQVQDATRQETAERRTGYQAATSWLRAAGEVRRWDDQVARNRDPSPFERRAVWADRFGMHDTADRIREGIDSALRIADKMDRCPNNPRNGGEGFDRGDGTWTDRRGPGWQAVEDARELENRLVRTDPLTRESLTTEEIVHRAEVERRVDAWERSPDNPRNHGREREQLPEGLRAEREQERER